MQHSFPTPNITNILQGMKPLPPKPVSNPSLISQLPQNLQSVATNLLSGNTMNPPPSQAPSATTTQQPTKNIQTQFKCDKCDSEFNNSSLLKSHQLTRSYIDGQKYRCKMCNFKSCHFYGMKAHKCIQVMYFFLNF